MRLTKNLIIVAAALTASACADFDPSTTISNDPDEYPGLEELNAPLTPLATPCVHAAVSGVNTMTVVVADDETAVVSKRSSDGALLVNGIVCGDATSTATKAIDIDGSSGTNTVILDFINGTFVQGSTNVGITVDLVSGLNDALKIRGSTSADTVTFGADGISFNTDNNLDVSAANVDAYTVTLGSGNDTFSGEGGKGTGAAYAGIMTLYGGPGNDTLTGGAGVDTISGGPGNDTLSGSDDAADDILNGDEGDDTFDCGLVTNGADTFNGGADTDTVSYASRAIAVVCTIDATANDGEALETDDIAADVESIVGGDGDDTLTGSANDDTLDGGPGDDTIVGGDGDDTLKGGDGDDILTAGADTDGADIFNGGAGTDTATYAARGVGEDLTITIGSGANDGESGELDDIQSTVENIIGGAGDDTISGSSADNTITGGDGDDTLDGGAGDDTFLEGTTTNGADTFTGGSGTDTVDYSARTAALTVTMDDDTGNDGLAAEADDVSSTIENLLCGTGADVITGNANDNLIETGAGIDTVNAGAGNDEIFGEAGDDVLNGGDGDDTIDGGAGDDDIDCEGGQGDIGFIDAADTTSAAVNCEL
ncbi:MAG: Ca2+-binding RTX toxin-like protein [Myxococcota bacterium]|jgi:Ca2+-binding RTX toxin-like protein